MTNKHFVLVLGILSVSAVASQALPKDVSSRSWAASAVQEAIANKVLRTLPDGSFHGSMPVTRAQVVVALAAEAHVLTAGSWQHHKSSAVPESVVNQLNSGDWRAKPVTRYMLASVLTRMGDYLNNGLHRAAPGAKDTAKSVALPPVAKVHVSPRSPYYSALHYLAVNKMVWSGSVLLQVNNAHVTSAQLSEAVAEMAEGVTNRVTSLGFDKTGATPDKTFHPKR
jgi:hypothetical protein